MIEKLILPFNRNITKSITARSGKTRPGGGGTDNFDFIFGRGYDENEANRFVEPVRDDESDPFLHSLKYLTPDDIAPPEPPKHRTVTEIIVSGMRTVLFFASIGVFAVSAVSIINTLYNYKRGDDIYAALAEEFYGDIDYSDETGAVRRSPDTVKSAEMPDFKTSLKLDARGQSAYSTAGKAYNDKFEKTKVKLNYLKSKNADLYGWITIPDTNIDYPMVQGKDNDYYLNNAFTGEYLPAGSIFVDYRCNDSIMKNHNTVIYGHNMTNGLMFNHVTKYLDKKFFDEHPYIEISTLDGIYTYEVFAIYQTDMYYSYIKTDFYSHEEFVDFAYEMKSNSLYEREGVEFNETDRIVTLSTCTNGYWTNRYCLQAKLVNVSN